MPQPLEMVWARVTSGLRWRRLLIDLVIAVALLVGSGIWATRYWNTWVMRGGEPRFYQEYFEPAVMVACGRGFVAADGQRPLELSDFLLRRRDTFDCRDIPGDLKLGTKNVSVFAWRYLILTVAWSWRVLGISWSRMGPLFGVLFGVTITLVYAIARLGMGHALAALCALGLSISTLHLTNVPHLRDYAKAPFTLALILILGLLVTRPIRPRTVLGLAAAYGLVLGVGYGFRTDFLANLPVFVVVVVLFLDGGVFKNLTLKAGALLLFGAAFILVSWPVTSVVYTEGGCQWHNALLGLQSPFDAQLRIAPAPYDFGYAYADGYIARTVRSYAHRTQHASAPIKYCSHEYDVESWRYLQAIAASFPADVIARGYASVLQVVDLPFRWWGAPMENWATSLYGARQSVLQPRVGWGAYIAGAAMVLASGASVRLGLYLLFFTAYFGGYPALQFHDRHYFHLEFMTWWALGFIVHQTALAIWSLKDGARARAEAWLGRVFRGALVMATAITLAGGVLVVARWYQAREARRLLKAYIAAPKMPVALSAVTPGRLQPVDTDGEVQYLEVDLNQAACRATPAVTFRYASAVPDADFSRTVTIARRTRAPGPTRIFLAVFEHFRGLEFSDVTPGCVAGVSRVADLRPFAVLLDATLPPDWQALPLYQGIADVERVEAGH